MIQKHNKIQKNIINGKIQKHTQNQKSKNIYKTKNPKTYIKPKIQK